VKKNYTAFILENYEASRSDDILLIFYHLRRHGLQLTSQQLKQLREICKETVSLYDLIRYRQKLQSEDKYLGTPEVMTKRHKKGVERTQKEREEKQIKTKEVLTKTVFNSQTGKYDQYFKTVQVL
jgi:hypothetical protein